MNVLCDVNDEMIEEERARWRAGEPLLHRDTLEDFFACEPEEIFSLTERVNVLIASDRAE